MSREARDYIDGFDKYGEKYRYLYFSSGTKGNILGLKTDTRTWIDEFIPEVFEKFYLSLTASGMLRYMQAVGYLPDYTNQ